MAAPGRSDDLVGMTKIEDACTTWAQNKYGPKYKFVSVDTKDLKVTKEKMTYYERDGEEQSYVIHREQIQNLSSNPSKRHLSYQSTKEYSCAWTTTKGTTVSGKLSVKVGLPAAVGLTADIGGEIQLSSTKAKKEGKVITITQETSCDQPPWSILHTEIKRKEITMPYRLDFCLEGTLAITLKEAKGLMKKKHTEEVDVTDLYPKEKTETDGKKSVLLTNKGSFQAIREMDREERVEKLDPDKLMKMIHNALLRDNREKIVEEVKDKPALSRLLEVMSSEQVISEEQSENVSQNTSVKECVNELVDVLQNVEPEKFLLFVDILQREGYSELVEPLDPRQIYPDNVRHIANLSGVVDHYFVTRKESEVKNSLQTARGAILHGMPGSGKTQLAIKVAGDYARMHPHAVVWVLDGSSEERLQGGIDKLQQRLDGEANVVDISMFQSHISRWKHFLLLINDLSPTVTVPHQIMSSSAKLIITTQDSFLCHEDVRSIPLEGFTEDEAVEFLSSKMPVETSREEMKELANLFSCLPLGLAAARASIHRGNMTVAEYRLQLRGGRAAMEALMDREDRWLRKYYKPEHQAAARNIFAALQLAIDSLDDQCNPEAEKTCKVMLQPCAFLEPNNNIPVLILKASLTSSPTIGSEAHFTEKMKMYSLGSIVGEGVKRRLSIHGVTQMALRLQLDREQQTTACIYKLLQILVKFFSKDTMYAEMYEFSLSLMFHVVAALRHADKLELGPEYALMKARLLMVYGHLFKHMKIPVFSVMSLNIAERLLVLFAGIAERYSIYASVSSDDFEHKLDDLYKSLEEKSQSLDDNFFQETVIRRVITEEHLRAVSDNLGPEDRITLALENMVKNFEPLTTEMYETLVGRGLAIPIETMKKTFLPELYCNIIYTRCKAISINNDGSRSVLQQLSVSANCISLEAFRHAVCIFPFNFLMVSDMVSVSDLMVAAFTANSLAERMEALKMLQKMAIAQLAPISCRCYDFGVLTNVTSVMNDIDCYETILAYCIIAVMVAEHADEGNKFDVIAIGQEAYNKLLALIERETKAGNPPTRLADYYNTAGEFKLVVGELEEAAETLWKAYRVELERGEYHQRMGGSLNGLIDVRIKQNELRRARVCARRFLQLALDHWSDDRKVTGYAREKLKVVCCKIVFRVLKQNQEEDKSNCMKVTTV